MNAHAPLAIARAHFERMKTELVETYGLNEADPALWDTLDGETDFGDALASMIKRARELEAHAESLGTTIKGLQERKAHKVDRARQLRAVVLHFMDEVGMPRLERPEFVATPTRRPAGLAGLDTVDVDALPDALVRIKREPNASAIKAAIEAGQVIEGVRLGNPSRTLRIV